MSALPEAFDPTPEQRLALRKRCEGWDSFFIETRIVVSLLNALDARDAELSSVRADPMWQRINELGAKVLASEETLAAKAWDEGAAAGGNFAHVHYELGESAPSNPYRKAGL